MQKNSLHRPEVKPVEAGIISLAAVREIRRRAGRMSKQENAISCVAFY